MAEQKSKSKQSASRGKGKRKRVSKARRRRQITVAALAALLFILVLGIAVACSKSTIEEGKIIYDVPEVSCLTINEDGTVTRDEIYDVSEDFDVEALEQFVYDEVDTYNTIHGAGSIAVNILQVYEGQAYLRLTYSSISTYADYTGYEAVIGTAASLNSKYAFDEVYVSVEDGVKGDYVESTEVSADAEYTLLIIRENTRIVVPGGIVYVSDYATELVDINIVDMVQPDGNEDSTVITYIFYDESVEIVTEVEEEETEEE